MRTTMIIAAALVVGLAVPAAIAHTEQNPNACKENRDPCGNAENHRACKGDRSVLAGNHGGYQLGITLAEEPEQIGAYLDTRGDGEEQEDGTLLDSPGILYIESNGFENLQRSDWKCKSKEHEVPHDEWVEHPDQVVL